MHVCPTGIDIRQGLQMECLGCTACIDACDDVMRRLHRPTGLIRHASNAQLAGGRTRWWRPRTVLYGVLLFVGAVAATWAISTVRPAAMSVLRMPGGTYVIEGDEVRNQFLVRVGNKTNGAAMFRLEAEGLPEGAVIAGAGENFEVGAVAEAMHVVVLRVPRASYRGRFTFQLHLQSAADRHAPGLRATADFRGPDPQAWGDAKSR